MPIYHDVAQYSEAYDRLKLGVPTSSNFHKIITPQGKPSKQWREYACVLIAERLLQHKIEFYNSPAMERGVIVEAEAADWYEFDQDVITQRIGFITDDDHTMGCSPDRLVGEDGLLEIKAPLPHTQIEYWISGKVHERFWPQLQGQLYITQRSWVDIVCWHDVLPKLVMRVEPDEKFIKALDHELQIFSCFVEGVVDKIRARHQLPMPPGGSALRAALRASLEILHDLPPRPTLRGSPFSGTVTVTISRPSKDRTDCSLLDCGNSCPASYSTQCGGPQTQVGSAQACKPLNLCQTASVCCVWQSGPLRGRACALWF